jgi:hypothetical protein
MRSRKNGMHKIFNDRTRIYRDAIAALEHEAAISREARLMC